MALPRPLRRPARSMERFLLGAVMTLVAVVIERRLLKAIRKGSGSGPEPVHAPGRVTVATTPNGDSAD